MNATTHTAVRRRPPCFAPVLHRVLTAVVCIAAVCCIGSAAARAADDGASSSTWGTMMIGGESVDFMPTIWSPDGKWLAFVERESPATILSKDHRFISIVSPDGGTPRRLYNNYTEITREGVTFSITHILSCFGGFSPDNKYLYYAGSIFDESKGSSYTFEKLGTYGYSLSVSNMVSVVNRLDISTGEVVEIAEGYNWCALSRSGKILLYGGYGKDTVVKKLETGETWTLPVCYYNSCCVTPDDQSVIYTPRIPTDIQSTEGQLYRIPIGGGTAVKLTQYTSGDIFGRLRTHPVCSPDGKWVLYLDRNETITYPYHGATSSGTVTQKAFFALNLHTGETIALTPIFEMGSPFCGNFNADGTKFCYLREDNSKKEPYAVYIKDFDPESLMNGAITTVAETLPAGFAIAGNHPNPFNPSTAISFTLPKAGTASLTVYDITGRMVRELTAGAMTAGTHSVAWNGRDSSGRAVSSGVYLARLSWNGAAVTHRMTLMK